MDQAFDLLFTAVVLPKGMSGVDLAKRAQAFVPSSKVLSTSGSSEHVFGLRGRPDPDPLLLRKLYRGKDLVETLRKVLDRRQR